MSSLTLNKITAQKGISVGEAAKKIADLGWTTSYVQEAMTHPTDYTIAKAPRDPMKQVLRSYFPMQEEKDNRVYGALDDVRGHKLGSMLNLLNSFNNQERVAHLAEYNAGFTINPCH